MGMTLGDRLRVTLFGESHGTCVGALVEGVPPGTLIDPATLASYLALRKPGRRGLTTRSELDDCDILSGIYEGEGNWLAHLDDGTKLGRPLFGLRVPS